MSLVKAIVLAAALVTTVACGHSYDNKTAVPKVDADPNADQAHKNVDDIDKVKWAGAIVIEGGEGKGLATFGPDKDNKPKFRVHVCLKKTDEKQSSVTLKINLNSLGLDSFDDVGVGTAGDKVLTRKLDKIDIQVKFATKIVKEHGYAYSLIQATTTSVPSYSVAAQVGDFDAEQMNAGLKTTWQDHVDYHTYWDFSSARHESAGRPDTYIMTTLERLGYFDDTKPNTLTTTSCEGQDKRYFVEKL